MAFWPLLHVLNGTRRTRSWAELKLLARERFLPATAGRSKDQNPPAPVLFQMATAYWISQAIYVAAKLGIADLLMDGPQSSVALAAATRSDPSSLFRLMRALSSVGVFSQQDEDEDKDDEDKDKDRFALSRLAEALRSDVPGSLREILITIGEIHYQACGALLHSVQTGMPAFTKVFGTNLFDYLPRNAPAAEAFNRGMTNLSSLLAHAVLLAYDFSGISSVVDVGGGEGELLRQILELNPEMTGVVLDLSNAVESEHRAPSDGGRCLFVAGNFFKSVPEGADAYLLCGVVHDWDDDRAVTVLRNCRKAMTEKSRLLIVDMIVPDTSYASFSKLLDLNMMIMTGGRERTKAEFHALLDAADYRISRTIPTMAPQSIIEAMPK
jgi:SAM-dependent methyltransferase